MQAEKCSVRCRADKHLEIPNFDLEVKGSFRAPDLGEGIYHPVSKSRNHRCLIVHLARDTTDWKKIEDLLHKMPELSRQLSNLREVALRPVPITPLSDQEKEILRSFSMGKNSAEIARTLGITLQTLRKLTIASKPSHTPCIESFFSH